MTNQTETTAKVTTDEAALKTDKPPQQQAHDSTSEFVNAIGQFLLPLNRQNLISVRNNFCVSKYKLRVEFDKYLQQKENEGLAEKLAKTYNGKTDIGTILFRTGYLINTARGADFYRIKAVSLQDYRKKLLDGCDDYRNNGIIATNNSRSNNADVASAQISEFLDPALASYYEVDDASKIHVLSYEGTINDVYKENFQLTNWSCYICQIHFNDPDSYDQHIEEHGDDGDFKLLRNFTKLPKPLLEISYQLCKKSHYFCFTMKSSLPNIIIDKIIIMKSRTMFYVQNKRMPHEFPADGRDIFFVDSHLFTRYLEQPVVIVFHSKKHPKDRVVEQHHFIRTEEFPKLSVAINPNRLPSDQKFQQKFQLPQYLPPIELRHALKKSKLHEMCNEFADYLARGHILTQQNIRTVLNLLLQVEDMDSIEKYRKLTQYDVKLRQFDKDISFKMNNDRSADNLLAPFDEVLMIPKSTNKNNKADLHNELMMQNMDDIANKKDVKIYTGSLERISNGRVTILCDKKIDTDDMYTVVFRPMRLTLRYQYRALELLAAMKGTDIERFLFPKCLTLPRPIHLSNFKLFDNNISNNPEQMNAVMNIAHGPGPEAPFIIFGPPGTGKTATVVEAVIQLYVRRPDTRILITAGSNSACDELAMRLCAFLEPRDEPKAYVRIYSRTVETNVENMDDKLLECSNLYDVHFYPAIEVLHEYRIVICTFTVVGRLCTGKFGRDCTGNGLYSHIFVDECAASTEAETLVGLMGTLSPGARLILSGDHKQLGPILQSDRAASLGLSVSLMERLLNRECYRVKDDGTYNSNYQTRLCRNYRSHGEIVRLYSDLYYDSKLVAVASNKNLQDIGQEWYRSPNPRFPIIFHSVFGSSGQDDNSTSHYNTLELEVVLDYVRDLMYFGVNGQKVFQSDIGIISPYKCQYQRIKEQLNLRKWYDIQTGSVEIFQGKEKKIIIVSFVRSFTKTIGFLQNPRRLNVTLSRAKSLLILIGNPKTLSINIDYKRIIDECKRHNTLIGATIYDDDRQQVRIVGANNMKLAADAIIATKDSTETNAHKKSKAAAKNQRRKARKQQEQQNKDDIAQNVILQNNNLRQPMKKHSSSPSMQKKRMEFDKYKNSFKLCFEDAEEVVGINTVTEIENLDDLFHNLPRVPQQHNKSISTNIPESIRAISNKAPIELKKELLERMEKLQLKMEPKPATNLPTSITPIKKTTTVPLPSPAPTNSTTVVSPPVIPINLRAVLSPAVTAINSRTVVSPPVTPINSRTVVTPPISATTYVHLRQTPTQTHKVSLPIYEHTANSFSYHNTKKPKQKCIIA